MKEETKRRLGLVATVVYAALPLVILGLSGWRWRIWWGVPGLPLPWPLPLPVLLPEEAA